MKALLALILFTTAAHATETPALCAPITKELYNEAAKIIDDLSHIHDDDNSYAGCLDKPHAQFEACEKEISDKLNKRAYAMVLRLELFNFKVACHGVELSHTGSISVVQYKTPSDASMIITYDDSMPVSVSQIGLQ